MKRYSLILVTILIFGMVVPIIPIATSNYSNEGIVDNELIENTSLAANGDAVTVIKVSDDAPVAESAPDTNWDDDSGGINLECSNSSGNIARSWLKFNLTHLSDNTQFSRATVNLFTVSSVGSADYPRGVYYSENDTWTEETITWNNQPEYNVVPAAEINSPASPDMFDVGYWYEFEITAEVIQTLEQDGILTLVLALVNEDASGNTNLAFSSREYAIILGDSGFNVMPYVSLEYAVPTTTDLLVDGFSESPQIDYINSVNPEFSWTFNDADSDDFQKNFELEVWNNSAFDDTLLMHDGNSEISVVHDTAGVGTSSLDTFNLPQEVRTQYKWPASLITQSGVVDKLFFEMDVLSGSTTYNDLAIFILCVEDSSALTADYQSNYDGRTPIQVLNRSEYTAVTVDGFMEFDIENTFIVESNLNLIIEFRHTGASGTSATSNYTYSGGSWAINSGSGAYFETTALGIDGRTNGLKLEVVSDEILSGGPMSNTFPFGLSPGISSRFQFKYNKSLIGTSGVIDRILFPVTGVGNVIYENFSVYLVETPLLGELSHTDMDSNYGGQVPILVIDRDDYVIRNSGHMLVIDVDDLFYYTNTHDLLIELRFDSLVSGSESVTFVNGGGAYRAFDSIGNGNDIASYDLFLDFIYDTNSVTYTGPALVNATTYYWRVRTYDSLGYWGSWETSSFKYEVLTSLPDWSNLMETSSPIELGESMTVSLDVTHIAGVKQVLLEYDGSNHTMMESDDTYSYTWIPSATGGSPYTIYMESYSRTWATVSDSVGVIDTTSPTWVPAPADKVLLFGESLSYQLTATDLSGIASWTINDEINFEIIDGLVTSKTVLAIGGYYLNVTVTDNEGNSVSGTFIVAVIAATGTTQPAADLTWVVAGLIGVIVVLVVLVYIQNRKIVAVSKG
ncbi:MAG: CBM96 family carbohydrate-binding protein [Candidatus Thorarchaeota archaeon]|jgi:hypothetical protein